MFRGFTGRLNIGAMHARVKRQAPSPATTGSGLSNPGPTVYRARNGNPSSYLKKERVSLAPLGLENTSKKNTTTADANQQALRLARERTELALVRTRLAKERTFNAWLRTGLALMGAGVAIAKLMSHFQPQWILRLLAILFVIIGGLIIGLGLRTYFRVIQRIEKVRVGGHPFWYILTLAILLILAAIIGLVLVLLE